ncbi:MAG: hypothetical protein ACSLFP_03470 [Acidimicrobiales bacterium]
MERGAHRALVALLVVPLLLACSGDDSSDDAGSRTTAPRPTGGSLDTSTTVSAREGDPLVVVEQGVASYPDPFDITATLGGYGVIIENPNADVMATGVRVVTRILDPAGTELLVHRALLNAIAPGQRMAVGRTLIEPIDDPTQLEVTVEVSTWLLPAHPEGGFQVDAVVTEPEEAGGSITRFAASSTWPVPEEGVDVTAVYRAADGRILGAEMTIADLSPDTSTTGEIRLLSPIPDLATTEIFLGRGFAAQTVG